MENKEYDIKISDFNSAGIREQAESLGIDRMREIGGGYVAGHEGESDWYIGFYALPHPEGWEFRAANTNSDPIWEESDEQAFAELAKDCGVEI